MFSVLSTLNVRAAMARADIVRRHATQTKAATSCHYVCYVFFYALSKFTPLRFVLMCVQADRAPARGIAKKGYIVMGANGA